MNTTIKKFVNENFKNITEFAKEAGLHKSCVSEIMNNKRNFKKMTVENAYKISKAMNCSINSIYEREEK